MMIVAGLAIPRSPTARTLSECIQSTPSPFRQHDSSIRLYRAAQSPTRAALVESLIDSSGCADHNHTGSSRVYTRCVWMLVVIRAEILLLHIAAMAFIALCHGHSDLHGQSVGSSKYGCVLASKQSRLTVDILIRWNAFLASSSTSTRRATS